MDFAQFVQWVFYGLMSGCAIYVTNLLGSMKESIDELNIQIAVVIEKQSNHEAQFERLEKRIDKVEEKTGG